MMHFFSSKDGMHMPSYMPDRRYGRANAACHAEQVGHISVYRTSTLGCGYLSENNPTFDLSPQFRANSKTFARQLRGKQLES